MVTIKSGQNIWPKAFYDNGGGSFGFVPANKLQTGVVGANLQLGPGGPLLSGSTGQIILGSGGTQIILSSAGITGAGASFGGPVITFEVSLNGFIVPAGTATGVSVATSNNNIIHPLGYIPAVQGFSQDGFVGGGTPDPGNGTWRPWNHTAPTFTATGDIALSPWYVTPTFIYSDSSFYVNQAVGGTDPGAFHLTAGVDADFLYLNVEIFAADNPTGSDVPIPDTTFIITLSPTLVGGIIVPIAL